LWPKRVTALSSAISELIVLIVLAVFVSILLLKVRLRLLLKTVGCILLATWAIRREISVKIMWKSSRREDEVSTPDKETSTASSKSVPAASALSSVADAPGSRSVQSHPTTVIGKLLVVKGELSGKEALLVDGEVEGSITLHGQRLTVRPDGRIRGNIEAGHVILQGRVEGDIQASDRVELFKSGSFTGDLSTGRISIEEGAFFKGKLDIKKPETALVIETKPLATAAIPVASTSKGSLPEVAAKKSGKRWYE
jgi:cytoskeletal protein CcmA (bactofilin family)